MIFFAVCHVQTENESNITRRVIKRGDFDSMKTVKDLFLMNTGVMDVEDFAFEGLLNLQILQLSENYLKRIRKNMFSGAPTLRALYLCHNEIDHIDFDAFEIDSLIFIDLSHNLLKTIDQNLFTNAKSLMQITVANNFLEEISYDFSSAISTIDFSSNPIQIQVDLTRFTPYEYLSSLNLANTTSEIYAMPCDRPLDTMEAIYLSESNLTNSEILENLARVFPSLRYIYLENNKFEKLMELSSVDRLFPELIRLSIGCNPFSCAFLEGEIDDISMAKFATDICVLHGISKKNYRGISCV